MSELKTGNELSIDDRASMIINGWIAMDPDTLAHLARTAGRCKAGRAQKYTLFSGLHDHLKIFRAWSVEEAIAIGNKLLADAPTELSGYIAARNILREAFEEGE